MVVDDNSFISLLEAREALALWKLSITRNLFFYLTKCILVTGKKPSIVRSRWFFLYLWFQLYRISDWAPARRPHLTVPGDLPVWSGWTAAGYPRIPRSGTELSASAYSAPGTSWLWLTATFISSKLHNIGIIKRSTEMLTDKYTISIWNITENFWPLVGGR